MNIFVYRIWRAVTGICKNKKKMQWLQPFPTTKKAVCCYNINKTVYLFIHLLVTACKTIHIKWKVLDKMKSTRWKKEPPPPQKKT